MGILYDRLTGGTRRPLLRHWESCVHNASTTKGIANVSLWVSIHLVPQALKHLPGLRIRLRL